MDWFTPLFNALWIFCCCDCCLLCFVVTVVVVVRFLLLLLSIGSYCPYYCCFVSLLLGSVTVDC